MTLQAIAEALDHGRSCLLITGAPGAGKSTVSRLVATALSRSALLDGDHINRLIVSGRVWALGKPADEAARQVRLCNENLCGLAANFADAGFTPVIDWVVPDRQQLDLYCEALSPPDVCWSLSLLLASTSAARSTPTSNSTPTPLTATPSAIRGNSSSSTLRNPDGVHAWWLRHDRVVVRHIGSHS